MIIVESKKVMEKLIDLITSQMHMYDLLGDIEMNVEQGYGSYLSFEDELIEDCIREFKEVHTKKDAERLLVIMGLVQEILGEAKTNDDYIAQAHILMVLYLHSTRYNKADIFQDPFIRNIKIDKPSAVGKYIFDSLEVEKGELFFCGEESVSGTNRVPHIGYCTSKFKYPCIRTEKEVYFHVNQQTINLFKPIVNEVSGNVVSLGLGLGYFAYMAALKEDVKKVTIVEKNTDFIEVFNKYVLPNIKNPEKIEIVKADPYSFLKKAQNGDYDYCVVDDNLNRDEQILAYVRGKHEEKRLTNTKFLYYDELRILLDIQIFIMSEMLKDVGIDTDDEVAIIENPTTARKIVDIYDNTLILTDADIENILDVNTIKETIENNA